MVRPHLPAFRLLLLAAFGAFTLAANAQYPDKPIRLIVPQAAGSNTDIVARALAVELTAVLGQPLVIDNRPGAGLIIGLEIASKSAPDGYTLCMSPIGALAISPHMFDKLPYVIERDFQPIAQLTNGPLMLAVSTTLPVNSAREIVEYAKKNPGKLSFASSTAGSPGHLAGELLRIVTGGLIEHIPYKGGAPAIADLLAGRVQIMFEGMNSMAPHIKGGKLRGIAVTTEKRVAAFPDMPTMAESGLQGFDISVWQGMVAPAGLPRPLLDRINAAVNRAVSAPNFKTRMLDLGNESAGGTPEEFAALIKRDSTRWGEVIRKAGIKAN
ncbi:MAG: tripartite tricarboxylate transporter substrate binding protein [Betaproteobacteria bacterium]|nr:tripartite tricarboxylate transporter substrate binding protein [Betaproteobacteria bacterium]